jgi:serine/threonine protein kinase
LLEDRPVLGSATIPKKVGRYQVEAELGRGMMGAVYRAFDPLLGRLVAVKVVHAGLPVSEAELLSFEKRFLAEGQIVARLSHPGIVTLHEVGRDEDLGVPFMVLELLVGRTLREVIADGELLDWKKVTGVVCRLARALDYAHAEGVVHRDIKPANIMLLEDGSPKLMDFGIARLHAGFGLTTTGQFLGTPLYMSPEQALGEPVDGRSDLFSLGSVAYTLLTGRAAFDAESVPLILGRVAQLEPPPPASLNPKLPAALDYVCARALSKPAGSRYPRGVLFAEDLEDVTAGRPPRHQAGWAPPQITGGGTLVSRVNPAVPKKTEPAPSAPVAKVARPAAPRRRRRLLPRLALLAACLAALVAVFHYSGFWRNSLRPLLRPASETEREQALSALDSAADEATERLQDGARRLAALVEPEPGGEAPPTELGSGPAQAAGEPVGADPEPGRSGHDEPIVSMPGGDPTTLGRLSLSVASGITGAILTLLVDEVPVYRGTLTGGPEPQPVVFRLAEGGYHGVLSLEAGDHTVRARLETEGIVLEDLVFGSFAGGQSRHLDVRADPDRLLLAWRGPASPADASSQP